MSPHNNPHEPDESPDAGVSHPALSTFGDAWFRFAGKLAESLAVLGDEQYLILSVPGSSRFIQFGGGQPFLAETVSNAFLEQHERLTRGDEVLLAKLGWQRPTYSAEDLESLPDDLVGSPNWFVTVEDESVPFDALASLAVRTAVEAFGVSAPSALRYRAFHAEGVPILLPGLELAPEEEADDLLRDMPVAPGESLAQQVFEACAFLPGAEVEPIDDLVAAVDIEGLRLMVVVEPELGIARLLCNLFPVNPDTDDVTETLNALNADRLAFGYVYLKDHDVRYGADVVIEPFFPELLPASIRLAAASIGAMMDADDEASSEER
ncbi:TY-Chap domain-containing protein [Gemmatimonas sp.]|uniref:TY-Chap domain-containing protein n=1 Tax=Gemmatimonas sp. TaxID=1962908 RepID=UPI003DA5081C